MEDHPAGGKQSHATALANCSKQWKVKPEIIIKDAVLSSFLEDSWSRSWVLGIIREVQVAFQKPTSVIAVPVSLSRKKLSFPWGRSSGRSLCPQNDHHKSGFSCPIWESRDWFCQFSQRLSNLYEIFGSLSHAGKLIAGRFIKLNADLLICHRG